MSWMFRPRQVGLAAASALVIVAGTSWLSAAKPPPPPPPPANLTGLIFHERDDGPWAVRADDTGATPVAGSRPCFHAQGPDPFHDRWYLKLLQTGQYDLVTWVSGGQVVTDGPRPHYDLFAYRSTPGDPSQIETVQLTDLFGILRISNESFWFSWSPDSNEDPLTSFVAFQGYDIRSSFAEVDGQTWYDHRESTECVVRLPLTASAITAGWLNEDFVPYRPADPGDLDSLLAPEHYFLTTTLNGEYLVFALDNRRALLLDPINADINNPHSVVWGGNTEGEPSNFQGGSYLNGGPEISPDGKSVVGINWYSDSRGGVWVLSLDRSFAPRQLVKNSQKNASNWTRYETAFFSPDSQYVLSAQVINKAGTFSGGDLVFPAAGGAAVKSLVNTNHWVTRWVSADAAP